ncbi:TrmH family RNA methyltransferase, partial [Fusobacterium periodonticum]
KQLLPKNPATLALVGCQSWEVQAYNEKVIRATMGSILNVNLFYLEKQEIIKLLKENNYSIIATYLDKEALPYNKIKLKEKNAVIFGNEGRGICDEFVSISDCKTVIPILSNTESLNVAVASAIILYKFREIEGLI